MSFSDVLLPPSPPTTTNRKSFVHITLNSTTTPEDSPASLLDSSGNNSRKRVEFLPWTDVHDPPTFVPFNDPASAVKPLPPSRDCQSITKSILKPYCSSEPLNSQVDGQAEPKPSMNDTMESILQQLSTFDRTAKVDAYLTLSSLLKAYKNVPEAALLKNKVLAITKCIRRDLCQDKSDLDPADINVITQALKTLVVFVWSEDLSPLLTEDFKVFVLERSIQVISENKSPKSIIIHYVHLLATQTFHQNLLKSNNRAGRILDALKGLTDHLKGNGIMTERLMVYQRLIDQARPAMQTRAGFWVKELFTALVSSVRETRTKAITFGWRACSVFPLSPTIAQTLCEILKEEDENGSEFGTYVRKRLEKIVASREDGLHVPRTWGIVVLLMGGLRGGIDKWSALTDWLKLIQRCFNSGDVQTRVEANLAWNRYVYVVRPHETSETMVSMLLKPIVAQMDRSGTEKQSKSARIAGFASYYNLLYYAFRPAATHKQYTRAWNEYIVKVMTSSFFDRNPANADLACRILMALLSNTNGLPKVWKEARAHEASSVEPEELPTIDCKWVRAKAGAILQIFGVIFKKAYWGPTGPPSQAFVAQAWRQFAKALGEASSREIKPTLETRDALLQLLKFVEDLHEAGTSAFQRQDPSDIESCSDKLHYVCRTIIVQIGGMPFAEVMETDFTSDHSIFLEELFSFALSAIGESNDSFSHRGQSNPHRTFERLLSILNSALTGAYDPAEFAGGRTISSKFDMAISCLRIGPEGYRRDVVSKLESSLALWIEDAAHVLGPQQQSITQGLTDAIVVFLAGLKSEQVEQFETLFCAGFRSKHEQVINKMIMMWNTTFGQREDLTCPPLIENALRRIQSFVDVDLPGTVNEDNNDTPPTLLDLEDGNTQAVVPQSPQINDEEQNEKPQHNEIDAAPIMLTKTERPILEAPSSTGNPLSTPGMRVRHDDSQVQFVSIESSPPAEEMESQYLTDRQKEVRNRQRSEPAVFFSDLGQRPSSASDGVENSSCLIARKAAASEECPGTPILQPNADAGEEVASPTPRRKHQALRLQDIEDMPSSPLSIPDDGNGAAGNELFSSPIKDPIDQEDHLSLDVEMPLGEISEQPLSPPRPTNVPVQQEQISSPLQPELLQEIASNVQEQLPFVASDDSDNQIREYDSGEVLEFSEVSRTHYCSPSKEQISNGELNDMETELLSSPLHSGTDSDEIDIMIASQLSIDLDRHVELASKASTSVEQVSTPSPKRKEPSLDRDNRKKRTKISSTRSSDSPDLQANLPVTHPEQTEVLDCIVVATPRSSQPEKRKAVVVDVRESFVEPTSNPIIRKRGRPRKSSRTSSRESRGSQRLSSEPSPRIKMEEAMRKFSDIDAHGEDTESGARSTFVTADEHINPLRSSVAIPEEVPPAAMGTEMDHRVRISQSANYIHAEENIMTSLQRILERMKQAKANEVDLRAVHELLFDIRTEAQNALQRVN